METSAVALLMSTCSLCVLSSLVWHSFHSWRVRSVSCFLEISPLNLWSTLEWRSSIFGCWDLRTATKLRKFLISFIIRSKSSFKMPSFMISTWSSRSSTFTKNFLPLSRTRSPSPCSRLSKTTLTASFWTLIQVSSTNWSWACIAESTSLARPSSHMVKSSKRCFSSQKDLPFSLTKRVWLLSSSSPNTLSSENTSWCLTSDLLSWSKSVAKKTTWSKQLKLTGPLSFVSHKRYSSRFLNSSQNQRSWSRREL